MSKLTKLQLDQIIELIEEHSEVEIETNGYHDYDCISYVPEKDKQRLLDKINKLLEVK